LSPSLAAIAACAAFAQSGADSPAFEGGSVKPSDTGVRGWSVARDGGGNFTAGNIPLKALITFAYDIGDE
jgi:hypothetical protein